MGNISPRIDIAFKKIFGVEENKDLLISLINAVVDEKDEVADVILLNPYNMKNYPGDKLSILDIKAKGVDGKLFNVEIQITDQADYDKRALYYWGKLYTEQLKDGEAYRNLHKTIGIHILNFISIVGESKYHNIFRIKEEESGLHHFRDFEIHTIELNKFADNVQEDLTDIANKVKTSLDRWVAFLTKNNLLKSDNLPTSLDDTRIKKALNVLQIMSLSEEEREIYEGKMKWYRDEESMFLKARDEARDEGLREGLREGEKKGKLQVAKSLLTIGMSKEEIARITGLDVSEL